MKHRLYLPIVLVVSLLLLLSSCIVIGNPFPDLERVPDTKDTDFDDVSSFVESNTEDPEESSGAEDQPSPSPDREEGTSLPEEEDSPSLVPNPEPSPDLPPLSGGNDSNEEQKPNPPTDFYERLIYENLVSNVLSSQTNFLMKLETESAEKESYWYYSVVNGVLWIDASRYDEAAARSTVYSVRGDAYYSKKGNALSFFVIPDDAPDDVAALFGPGIFASGAEYLDKHELEGGLLQCTSKLNASSSSIYDYVLYTYVADAETLLLKSAKANWIKGDLTVHSTLVTFSYSLENFEADLSAYNAHLQATDQITLSLYDEEGASSVYTLAADSKIGAASSIDGTEYALYKNEGRTKDVNDLSFSNNKAATVYLGKWTGDVSFEFALGNEDVERFDTLLSEFEELAKQQSSDTREAFKAHDKVYEMFEYIRTESNVAYVNYYSDLASETYWEQYSYAEEIYSNVYSKYYSALLRIKASDSPFKAEFFADWSAEELEELERDYSGVSDLQSANNELLDSYFDLNAADVGWGDAVNHIYEQFIQNSNEIADVFGYENYYEYASVKRYRRDYSKEQRGNFRAYVKQYIVPLYMDCYDRYNSRFHDLSISQFNAFNELISNDYRTVPLAETYVNGYFEIFDDELQKKLSSMLTKNSTVISDAAGAYEGAFTTYFDYYEEPVAYFHEDFMDLLTVIHENGHYAAYYGIGGAALPGLDLCETHSQGNEWLFMAYLEDAPGVDRDVYEVFLLRRLLTGLQGIVLSTLVDECEESFYSAETPFASDEFDAEIERIENTYGEFAGLFDVNGYFKRVVLSSPVYYISYATSELASIALYVKAINNFDETRDDFSRLLNEADSSDTFLASLEAAGLPSPFELSTFENFEGTIGMIVSSTQSLAA